VVDAVVLRQSLKSFLLGCAIAALALALSALATTLLPAKVLISNDPVTAADAASSSASSTVLTEDAMKAREAAAKAQLDKAMRGVDQRSFARSFSKQVALTFPFVSITLLLVMLALSRRSGYLQVTLRLLPMLVVAVWVLF
jgi:hypothetical protein